MKEQFKNYLSQRLSPNTVNSYMSGLNRLSNDYGKNILEISDAEVVGEIRKLYGIGGAKRRIGDHGNGCARNAIIQYYNFILDYGGEQPIAYESDSIEEVESADSRFTYERDLHNTLKRQTMDLFPEYQLIGS